MTRSVEGRALAALARYIERDVRETLSDRDAREALKDFGVEIGVTPADMARGTVIGMLLSALLDELCLGGNERIACREVLAAALAADQKRIRNVRRKTRALH